MIVISQTNQMNSQKVSLANSEIHSQLPIGRGARKIYGGDRRELSLSEATALARKAASWEEGGAGGG